uniref:Uncharacterized protein n=1 Tax=Amicula sp. isolate GU52X-4 cfCalB7 TaxID=3003489 RepID=A0A9E9C241_9STRA|nr:hypothetical protein [Amicula sp. isolate GU52X-4 cfCalB7]WAK84977.1 hypothetical protein [Amicula sp. isolate GU52X-4 cfCalB7]
MYYDLFTRKIRFDSVDIFLISFILANIAGRYVKHYLSEEAAMERLKQSIIKESELLKATPQGKQILKKAKVQKIARVAMGTHQLNIRGGDLSLLLDLADLLKGSERYFAGLETRNPNWSKKTYIIATKIKAIIGGLLSWLKNQEGRVFLKIVFSSSRVVLELMLSQCDIDILHYIAISEGNTVRWVAITTSASAGTAAGFTAVWFTAGAKILLPLLAGMTFALRTAWQQRANILDYRVFLEKVDDMMNHPRVQNALTNLFDKIRRKEVSVGEFNLSPESSAPITRHTFGPLTAEQYDQMMQQVIQERLGLIKDPSPDQISALAEGRRMSQPLVLLRETVNDSGSVEDAIDAVAEAIPEAVRESIAGRIRNE